MIKSIAGGRIAEECIWGQHIEIQCDRCKGYKSIQERRIWKRTAKLICRRTHEGTQNGCFIFLHKYYVGQNDGSNFFVNQLFLAYSRLIFFHFHNKAFQSLQGHVIKKLQLSIGCRFLISIQKTDEHSTHQEVRRGGRTPKRFLTENLCPSLVNESFEDKEPTTQNWIKHGRLLHCLYSRLKNFFQNWIFLSGWLTFLARAGVSIISCLPRMKMTSKFCDPWILL